MYDWADLSDLDIPSKMYSWDDLSNIISPSREESKSTTVEDSQPAPNGVQTSTHPSSTLATSSKEEKKSPSSQPELKKEEKLEVFHCSIAEDVSKLKRNRSKPDIYQSPIQFKAKQKPKKSINSPIPKRKEDSVTFNDSNAKRSRNQTEVYQSPTVPKCYTEGKKTSNVSPKPPLYDESIIFQKYEFLTVRNDEDGFYICQTLQNVLKTTDRMSIRWLSQDENHPDLYYIDYCDETELDCVLTNVNLNKVSKDRYQLTKYDLLRTQNLLNLSISKFKENSNDN